MTSNPRKEKKKKNVGRKGGSRKGLPDKYRACSDRREVPQSECIKSDPGGKSFSFCFSSERNPSDGGGSASAPALRRGIWVKRVLHKPICAKDGSANDRRSENLNMPGPQQLKRNFWSNYNTEKQGDERNIRRRRVRTLAVSLIFEKTRMPKKKWRTTIHTARQVKDGLRGLDPWKSVEEDEFQRKRGSGGGNDKNIKSGQRRKGK